jgi:solute carrier family 8 (sodium/calcium exchanger)
LIFQPGETQRQIEISVIDDDVFEEDEHFFVKLSNVRSGSASGPSDSGERSTRPE